MAWKETLAFCEAIITSVRSTPPWPISKALAMSLAVCWVALTLFTAWPSRSWKLGMPCTCSVCCGRALAMASICMERISSNRRLNSTP
ncbi:hypothetical protein FQZ97_701490 [compost metagenome]